LPQKSSTEQLLIAEASDTIRRRYGKNSILRGHDLWLRQRLALVEQSGSNPLPNPGKN
jgi:hypothetical protein